MKYNVKCSNCGKTFAAETDKYGENRFRCPYCGTVLKCIFKEPEPFRTRAREVIPLSASTPVQVRLNKKLKTAETKLIHLPSKEKIAEMKDKLKNASKHVSATSSNAADALLNATNSTSKFVARSSSRIMAFQQKYKDGDLWIFFGFSFAFIVLTILCLLIGAEVTKAVAEGQSWLFKHYIMIKNML